VVKEVPLPINVAISSHKLLSIVKALLHARFTRKNNDGMQVVGHKQTKLAMPNQFRVVVSHSSQYGIASSCEAKLVFAFWKTLYCDEEWTAVGDPRGYRVRQLLARRSLHKQIMIKVPMITSIIYSKSVDCL
jgi:hypothetical protein